MQTEMWRDTHQAIIMQFQVNKVVINYASGIWYDASFLGRSKENMHSIDYITFKAGKV